MEHVALNLVGATWEGREVQSRVWRIREGDLLCENCNEHIFPGGGDTPHTSNCALAVFAYAKKPPTNFVCPVCRGLLKKSH